MRERYQERERERGDRSLVAILWLICLEMIGSLVGDDWLIGWKCGSSMVGDEVTHWLEMSDALV